MNGGKSKDCCECEAPKERKHHKKDKCEECKPPKERKHHKKKEECCDCGCGDHWSGHISDDHTYPIHPAPDGHLSPGYAAPDGHLSPGYAAPPGHLSPGLPSAYPGMAAPPMGPAPEKIDKPKDTGKDTGKDGGEPKKTSAMPPAVELAPATTNVSETGAQHPF